MSSLRDSILACDDRRVVPVPTPEWPAADGKLGVSTITESERSVYEAEVVTRKKAGEYEANLEMARVALVRRCTVAMDTREPVFTAADVQALRGKCSAVVARLYNVAAELNGMTPQDVEELVGNSAPALSVDSGTA